MQSENLYGRLVSTQNSDISDHKILLLLQKLLLYGAKRKLIVVKVDGFTEHQSSIFLHYIFSMIKRSDITKNYKSWFKQSKWDYSVNMCSADRLLMCFAMSEFPPIASVRFFNFFFVNIEIIIDKYIFF